MRRDGICSGWPAVAAEPVPTSSCGAWFGLWFGGSLVAVIVNSGLAEARKSQQILVCFREGSQKTLGCVTTERLRGAGPRVHAARSHHRRRGNLQELQTWSRAVLIPERRPALPLLPAAALRLQRARMLLCGGRGGGEGARDASLRGRVGANFAGVPVENGDVKSESSVSQQHACLELTHTWCARAPSFIG